MAFYVLVVLALAIHLWFSAVGAELRGISHGAKALFVLGDSYADTGNHNASTTDPSLATPWRSPYGNTWPQHPSGRFSDGRVFTDLFASYLDVRKPIPYRLFNLTMKHHMHRGGRHLRHVRGINFAYGGSGVFPTFGPQYPNIRAQIDQLRDLMQRGLVSKKLIKASMILLVISGNDYTVYDEQHPYYQGISEFIPKVVEEMAVCLQELHDIVGFTRLAVTNLAPVGCLPGVTFLSNYTSCKHNVNELGAIHNSLLASRIASLQAKHLKTHFSTLDLRSAFETVISDGRLSLRPCCDGVDEERSCGDEDKSGRRLYSLCSAPSEMLFWDRSHPTNAGWNAISKALFSSMT